MREYKYIYISFLRNSVVIFNSSSKHEDRYIFIENFIKMLHSKKLKDLHWGYIYLRNLLDVLGGGGLKKISLLINCCKYGCCKKYNNNLKTNKKKRVPHSLIVNTRNRKFSLNQKLLVPRNSQTEFSESIISDFNFRIESSLRLDIYSTQIYRIDYKV